MPDRKDFKTVLADCRKAVSNVDDFRQAAGRLLVLCQDPEMQQLLPGHVISSCKFLASDTELNDLIPAVKQAYLDTVSPLSFEDRAFLIAQPALYVYDGPLYDIQAKVFDQHWTPGTP
ncbi:MAG: hypothetical protein V4621_05135 [Pseudomonadota bacterium]